MSENIFGLGVMIKMLGGNEKSAKVFSNAIGKEIKNLEITGNALVFEFSDRTSISLLDDGQSCCENRWMHTDDDLDYFIGSTLQNAEIRSGPNETDDEHDDCKESQFLIITTSLGQFTIVNYNEHNGYYGGFAIICEKFNPRRQSNE